MSFLSSLSAPHADDWVQSEFGQLPTRTIIVHCVDIGPDEWYILLVDIGADEWYVLLVDVGLVGSGELVVGIVDLVGNSWALSLTLKVPEKLQLYGLYVYYVVHICDFGMLRVNIRWEIVPSEELS